jgi:hypothetical protein
MANYSKNFLTSMTGHISLDDDNSDPDPIKLTPAEQKIADEYTKKGFIVNKIKGQLTFKKDPNFKDTNSTANANQMAAADPNRIPSPDYSNPESRLGYAQAFKNKYAKGAPPGFGDIALRVNEKPAYSTDTSKNLAIKSATGVGLDPAVFYASAMSEGMSGMYPGARKSAGQYGVTYTGDRAYPVSGMWHLGMDNFSAYLPTLIKKGYLPKDFEEKNMKWWDEEGGPAGPDHPESAMFKTGDAGMQAKAALLKQFYDEFDDYSNKNKINLTPEQRDFFALAHYNSGAHSYEMLNAYKKAGLLKDNKFLDKIPDINVPFMYKGKPMSAEASAKLHQKIYGNIAPRIAAARGLKEEGLFD